MQDCNPEMGNKKEPSAQLTPKGSITSFPTKVYHILKPKGNTMIELKITVNDAADLTKELTAVYEKVVGEPMGKVYPEAKAVEVKKATKPTKKAEPKAKPKVEEVPEALQWTTSDVKDLSTLESEEPKNKAVKEEPKQEELPVDVPSVEEVRAAVKDACSTKEDKQELKAFLESIKLDKVSNANDSQRLAIMDWVKARA